MKACRLIVALVVLLAGCIDCFDGAELEAAHRDGEAEADAVNQAEYARGHEQASLLTYEDGLVDGDRNGYEDGHFDAYWGVFGYPRGYAEGFPDGERDGLWDTHACSSGTYQGVADGERDGANAGWSDGYGQGWDDGYADGWDGGASSCALALALARRERDDAEVCRERGYERTVDRGAFDRGYESGKRDNVAYQAGYAEQYLLAYATGVIDGELDGYDAGLSAGYGDGYDVGYDSLYYSCYDQAYADGYDDGYDEAWVDGADAGYDEGWQQGFDEGRVTCE